MRIALTSGLPRDRVGRLMRINGIKPVRTRKHKVTTDSHHRLGVAANWLDGDFAAGAPHRKWAGETKFTSRSEEAQSSSVVSIDAPVIHGLLTMESYWFRVRDNVQL